MDKPESLKGGNSNQVLREGQTVLRKTGLWSPFVHELLTYLTANGFKESAVLLETSSSHERLSFLEGEVGHYPLKTFMQSDDILIESARLLRRFHDLTASFPIPANAQFLLPVENLEDYEVICHNDFAPYNCVFKDNRLAGIIDFDTAAPGKRLWDIAYAVYRFAPLVTDTHCLSMGWKTVPNRIERLKVFCDSYGLEDRSTLIETVIQRIEALVRYMTEHSSNLEHIPIYLDDLRYLRENRDTFTHGIS
jgi:hypothetical protein